MSEPLQPSQRTRYWGQIIRSGRHGQYVFTREAVEGMLEQLQTAPVPMNIEHDPTQVPVGRIIGARLEEVDGGEVALSAEMELFDTPTSALVLPVSELRHALLDATGIPPEAGPLTLHVDARSYAEADLRRLRSLAAKVGDVQTDPGMARFSQLPDALLVIALGLPTAAVWWFARGFFTKAGEAAGEEFGKELGTDAVTAYKTFKQHMRTMVTTRRSPADTPPITMLTLEVARPGSGYVTIEGSTRAEGEELDHFLDAGAALLAVALAYAAQAPQPERLAKLHFKYNGESWQFAYGLDDAAELVMIAVLGDDEYERALRDLRARAEQPGEATQ